MPSVTKILFLTANPTNTAALQLDEEIRLISQRIRRGEYRKLFEICPAPAIRATDLPYELMDSSPDIVHFSGHGSSAGELFFVREGDQSAQPIPAKTLARVFKQFRDRVKCVVLNACYSAIQAEAIAESIPCVVGMSRAVPDSTAIAFAAGFYEALAFGKSVAEAFELGQTQVELAIPSLADTAEIPQLIVRSGEDASKIYLLPPAEEAANPGASPTKKSGLAGTSSPHHPNTSGMQPGQQTPPNNSAGSGSLAVTPFTLRKLMAAVLRTSADLDGFCIDHFSEVARRFSSGMTRPAREDILLQLIDGEELLAALRLHDAARVEKNLHLLMQ
jgi:hypothetical protein